VPGVLGLTVDVPGDRPDLWGDVRQQSGLVDGFCEERPVNRGEGFERDKEGGSGGHPR
jgi:hypothetical protein